MPRKPPPYNRNDKRREYYDGKHEENQLVFPALVDLPRLANSWVCWKIIDDDLIVLS